MIVTVRSLLPAITGVVRKPLKGLIERQWARKYRLCAEPFALKARISMLPASEDHIEARAGMQYSSEWLAYRACAGYTEACKAR